MKVMLLALAFMFMSGCGGLGERIGTAVKIYCSKPEEERQLIRAFVTQEIFPNRVIVECVTDSLGQST